jgi:transcriptional regulator with XRE-family HTH domain
MEFVRLQAESGWVPADCVRELGITKGVVSQYRSGTTRPSLQVLRLFSMRTGIPLGLPGESIPQRQMPRLDRSEENLIGALRRIPPQQRRLVSDSICQIAEAFGSLAAGPALDSGERPPPIPMLKEPTNSAEAVAVAVASAPAALAAAGLTASPSRSPGAAGPTANRGGPTPISPLGRNRRQFPQAGAPSGPGSGSSSSGAVGSPRA